MLTLSPAASEALALVLAELAAAAKYSRRAATINLAADFIDGTVTTVADFNGCRPSLAGLVSIDPGQDGRTYAYTADDHMLTFPD